MARAVTPSARKSLVTIAAWVVGARHLLPDPLDGPDQLQDRARGLLDRRRIPVLRTGRSRTMRRSSERSRLSPLRPELAHHRRSARPCSRLIIAMPAAWAMAFFPTKRTKDLLLWMLSTKMMPPVGVLVPIYLFFRDLGPARHAHRADHRPLPRSTCRSWSGCCTPFSRKSRRTSSRRPHGRRDAWQGAHLRAAADGACPASPRPLLLNVILAWNEAFWTLNLTTLERRAADRLHRLLSPARRAVLGQASAASTLAIAPILVLGWFSQRQLVRGLTFGAVK